MTAGTLAAALALCAFGPGRAEAHLFHAVFELPDNQMTKDYLLLVRLAEFPNENFALAAEVYRGHERVRLKPGGFRGWLRRPSEPGMVFKAEYQLHRWTGSLEAECRRLDRAYGGSLDARVVAGLQARNAEAVKAAFREAFARLIGELLDAIARHLGEPEAPAGTYEFVARYFAVAHEAYLNVRDRQTALVLRAALDAVERSLGDPSRGIPPAPELFEQQRARFVRTLGEAVRPAGVPRA